MSDYDRDRGAYSPSHEPPLAFDARQAPRRGGRPPTTLIISALILVILAVAVVLYYRSGVRKAGEPPVVGAPVGDIKSAPPASAQPAPEDSGLQIYSAEQAAPAPAAPNFAAPPEQPLPRAQPAPKTVVTPPAPAAAAPASSAPANAAPAAAATPAPKPTTPEPVTPKPAATPAAAATAGSGSGAVVQIGAYTSPALADKGWNDLAREMPGQMIGHTKRVEAVTKGSDTLYRAYIGGFGSKAEAVSLCDALKAAGHSCLVK